ncbi:MAG: HEAT repeat domain-containing protein [Candidatus Wallbacteria bacterium]|nr:HEAT repeat domain-containing protein [Candidatus Wallbacteria bacterium]
MADNLKNSENMELLEQELRKTNDPVKVATVLKKIAFSGSLRAVPLLKSYLSHEDRRVRANAIEGLGYFHRDDLIPFLFNFLEKETDPRSRANIIRVLWKYGSENIYSEMEKMLFSGNSDQVKSGLFLAEQIDNEAVFWLVRRLSIVPDRELSSMAGQTLGRLSFRPPGLFDNLGWRQKAAVLMVTAVLIFGGLMMLRNSSEKRENPVKNDSFAEIIRMAKSAAAQGNYSLAAGNLQLFLRKQPDNPEALLLLGVCYYRLGSWELAGDNLERSWGADLGNGEVFVFLARIYARQGGMEKLAGLYRRSRQAAVPNTLSGMIAAYRLLSAGRWEEALSKLNQVREAMIPFFEEEWKEAYETCMRALEEEKSQKPFQRAGKLYAAGRVGEARDVLNSARVFASDEPDMLLLLARCEAMTGRGKEAREILARLISRRENLGKAFAVYAQASLLEGDPLGAYEACILGIQQEKDPELLYVTARTLMRFNELDRAGEELNRAEKNADDYLGERIRECRYDLARIRNESGANLPSPPRDKLQDSDLLVAAYRLILETAGQSQIEQTVKLLSEDGEHAPENPVLLNLEGIAICKSGDLAAGQQVFRELTGGKLQPAAKEMVLNNLACSLFIEGKQQQAQEAWMEIIRPTSPEYWHNRGVLALATGDNETAVNMFGAALKDEPFDGETCAGLAAALRKLGNLKAAAFVEERAAVLLRGKKAAAEFSTDKAVKFIYREK